MIYIDQFLTHRHDWYFPRVKSDPDTTSDMAAIWRLSGLITTSESHVDLDTWGLALNIVEAACGYGKYWNHSIAVCSASHHHVQLESPYNSVMSKFNNIVLSILICLIIPF